MAFLRRSPSLAAAWARHGDESHVPGPRPPVAEQALFAVEPRDPKEDRNVEGVFDRLALDELPERLSYGERNNVSAVWSSSFTPIALNVRGRPSARSSMM